MISRAGAFALILAAGLCLTVPGAVTITVPGDAATITAAVAMAGSGDLILVSGGPYAESITESVKTLTIEASPEGVVWDAGGGVMPLRSDTFADVTLRGFTLQGGTEVGAGTYLGGSLTVENCTIQNNGRGGGNATSGATLTLRNCLIRDNPPGGTSLSHNGVRMDNGGTTGVFEDCVIISDKVGTKADGMLILSGSQATVTNCVFLDSSRGFSCGNSGTQGTVRDSLFFNCDTAIYADRSANINAGSAGDVGGNVLFDDNTNFYSNSGANIFIAEGNIYPHIDNAYLTARVSGSVDYTPAFQVQIDRVAVNPFTAAFTNPIPDGQFIELRALSTEPSTDAIDLGGWMVSDDPAFDGGDEGVFTIPPGTSIMADESLLLAADLAALGTLFDIEPAAPQFDYSTVSPEISLDPTGDEVLLSPSSLGIMDAFLYGASVDTVPSSNWAGTRTALSYEGSVYARDNLGTDTDTTSDWSDVFVYGRVATLTSVQGWELYR
ncbi:MAG: right-handed parallel beta-helix repeat-containing protein [bacterium]|nr:right-handed parallel beta-helix repeat-containing protein [bacterium]